MKTIIQIFLQALPRQATLHIAYSGGVDSLVLLHAIATQRKQFPQLTVKAMHVNHQLQAAATEWVKHCEQQCQALNVELQVHTVNAVAATGESPEAAARKARYQIFAEQLNEQEYLATAHHLDDQAETVLLQLMRGAGVKGLAAMPAINPFAKGFLARPLLNLPQQTILDYAKQQQLSWVEDDSNQDLSFDRNFLRHQVFPLLSERRPNVISALARSAKHCAEANELLSELAAEDLQRLSLHGNKLSAKALQSLSKPRLRNLLRHWLQQQSCLLPSAIKMEHIIQDVIFSRYDAKPSVEWGGVALLRIKDELSLITLIT